MKIFLSYFGLLLASSFFLGCETAAEDPYYDSHNTATQRYINYDHKTQTGKIIKYYESGDRKSIGFYHNGRKDSLFRSWYENGSKKLVIWYDKGKKEGLYQYYRKEGPIYREIEYKDDLKHGLYQEFWKNGNLKYSLDYQFDFALDETMKEFKSTGNRKKDSYLVVREKNTVKENGKHTIYVYFEDQPKQAYYTAIIDGVPYALDMQNNKGLWVLDVPKGMFVMKKIQFEGFYEGRKQTIKSVKRNFNLGVENL